MKLVAVQIKLAFNCEECMQPIPLGGLVEKPRCDKCQSPAEPDWQKMLNFGNPTVTIVEWAQEAEDGDCETGGFASIHLDAECKPLQCACGATWDAAAIAAEGQPACPACAKPIASRRTPPHITEHYPQIVCVVGETQIAEDGEVPGAAKPVMFACMNCGAPLRIDGTQRIVDCGSCDVPNFIPDALWLRLHPAKKREPFWLVIEA